MSGSVSNPLNIVLLSSKLQANWSAWTLVTSLTSQFIVDIITHWDCYDKHVKVRVLLSLVQVEAQKRNAMQVDLRELMNCAIKDHSDEWVSIVAGLVAHRLFPNDYINTTYNDGIGNGISDSNDGREGGSIVASSSSIFSLDNAVDTIIENIQKHRVISNPTSDTSDTIGDSDATGGIVANSDDGMDLMTMQPNELKYLPPELFDGLMQSKPHNDFVYVGNKPEFILRQQQQSTVVIKKALSTSSVNYGNHDSVDNGDQYEDLFGDDSFVTKKLSASSSSSSLGTSSTISRRHNTPNVLNDGGFNQSHPHRQHQHTGTTLSRSTIVVSADQQRLFREQNMLLEKQAREAKRSLSSSNGPESSNVAKKMKIEGTEGDKTDVANGIDNAMVVDNSSNSFPTAGDSNDFESEKIKALMKDVAHLSEEVQETVRRFISEEWKDYFNVAETPTIKIKLSEVEQVNASGKLVHETLNLVLDVASHKYFKTKKVKEL